MRKKLFWTIIILLLFGLIMLSSAGIVEGQKKYGSPYYHVEHQFLFGVLPGLLALFLLSRIPYTFWKKISLPLLFFALVLMILVFVPGFSRTVNGAKSWIAIAGYSFQPAEVLKFALVIYLAAWFGTSADRVKNFTYGAVPFLVILGFIGILLMLQPDLGTLVVVGITALGVYIIAGARWKHISIMGIIATVALTGLIAMAPYRINRIKAFINPSIDPRGISYQLNQSLIAIGSGGIFGVGFGHSQLKLFGFIPETVTDSIFAVIAEELGLVGALFTIALFLTLFWFMILIARHAKDRFGQLFVFGMALWIITQAFINIAAVTGVGPLTGIPLPFISFGGTALVALLAGMGIVLNIAERA